MGTLKAVGLKLFKFCTNGFLFTKSRKNTETRNGFLCNIISAVTLYPPINISASKRCMTIRKHYTYYLVFPQWGKRYILWRVLGIFGGLRIILNDKAIIISGLAVI